jgi:hypothetical protein
MSASKRHHYIPKFYLFKWADSKGLVMCYQWMQSKLVALPLPPTSIGVQSNLYRLAQVLPELRQIFETTVASDVDGQASNALRTMTERGVEALTGEERLAWAQFLVSLPIRNPDAVADIKETSPKQAFEKAYERAVEKYPGWAKTYDLRKELKEGIDEDPLTRVLHANYGVLIIGELMVNPQFQQLLLDMHWWTVNFDDSNVSLLTSDRPYMPLRPLSHPRSLLYVPIGPRLGFFASPEKEKREQIGRVGVSKLAKKMNLFQVQTAAHFTYAANSEHCRLIEKHFHPVDATNDMLSDRPA